MPYLLPSSMTGDEDIKSVCVHYPDKPEFKSALLGALTFFTKWVAWERTGDERAKQAAMLWYKAHELTIADWDSECGNCDEMPDDDYIIDLIQQELENMTINNCITVNCGCCGNGSLGELSEPPIDYEEESEIIPEPDIIPPNTMDYEQYKCNAAHYLYYKFRLAVLELDKFKNSSGIDYDTVAIALGDLETPHGRVAQVLWFFAYQVVNWLVSRVNESAATIVQEMDRHYDQFVCAAYSGDGTNAKYTAWKAVIDLLALPWVGRYYLKLLSQSIDWKAWFYDDWESESEGLPPAYQSRDCTSCTGGSGIVPDIDDSTLPAGWYLVPVDVDLVQIEGDVTDPYIDLTWSFDNGGKILTAISNCGEDAEYSTPGLDIFTSYPYPDGQLAGMVIEVVGNQSTSTGMTMLGQDYSSRPALTVQGYCYDSANRAKVQTMFEDAGYTFLPDLTATFSKTGVRNYEYNMQRNRPSSGTTAIDIQLRFWWVIDGNA